MELIPSFTWKFTLKDSVKFILRSNIKQSHNLEEFKLQLKNLGNIHFACVVCR